MIEVDYEQSLDDLEATLQAFAAAADKLSISSAGTSKEIEDCSEKVVDDSPWPSKTSEENEYIFPGSTCSLEEFACTKQVMELISYPEILSCLFMDITSVKLTQEFLSFIEFIHMSPDDAKSQLKFLIIPLTVHSYALLMECEDIGVEGAKKFLNDTVNILWDVQGYKELLAELSTYDDLQMLKKNSQFSHFFECKTVISVSKNVFESLEVYFRHRKRFQNEGVLVSLLTLNVDFESSDVNNFFLEEIRNKDGESRGELKKSEIEEGAENELNPEDSTLNNIEITNITVLSRDPGHCFKFYNFDTEEVVVIDNINEYMENLRNPKVIDAKPTRLRNTTRNVSYRLTGVKQKAKEVKMDTNPKKEMEAKPNLSFKSLYSMDFNSAMTEIAYAIGDKNIYSMKIAAPKKKDKKTMNIHENFKVILRNFEHDESSLKKTRYPENQNVFGVKYLPKEPYTLLVASCSTVKLFNTDSGNFLASYITDGSFIYDMDVDFMSQCFATAHHNLSSYIYNFQHRVSVCTLTGHQKAVTSVKFHPNGIYVVTGSEDCTVRMFEVENGRCVRLFVNHVFGIWQMDFSYDGHLLASADSSGLVHVWDVKDNKAISEMKVHTIGEKHCGINSLCFHENSFILAACIDNGEVRLWDARNPAHRHAVRTLKKPVVIKRYEGKGWSIAYTMREPS